MCGQNEALQYVETGPTVARDILKKKAVRFPGCLLGELGCVEAELRKSPWNAVMEAGDSPITRCYPFCDC